MTPGPLDLTLYRGSTFGPITMTCKKNNVVVDITGYTPQAQVRTAPKKPLILDLGPTIPSPTNGQIIIYMTDEQTRAISMHGAFVWDLFLINPSGERLGPFLAGNFEIKTGVTNP